MAGEDKSSGFRVACGRFGILQNISVRFVGASTFNFIFTGAPSFLKKPP
jgi:hypothetical protein